MHYYGRWFVIIIKFIVLLHIFNELWVVSHAYILRRRLIVMLIHFILIFIRLIFPENILTLSRMVNIAPFWGACCWWSSTIKGIYHVHFIFLQVISWYIQVRIWLTSSAVISLWWVEVRIGISVHPNVVRRLYWFILINTLGWLAPMLLGNYKGLSLI